MRCNCIQFTLICNEHRSVALNNRNKMTVEGVSKIAVVTKQLAGDVPTYNSHLVVFLEFDCDRVRGSSMNTTITWTITQHRHDLNAILLEIQIEVTTMYCPSVDLKMVETIQWTGEDPSAATVRWTFIRYDTIIDNYVFVWWQTDNWCKKSGKENVWFGSCNIL